MKKILSLLFVFTAVAVSLAVHADDLSDARRREREARNRQQGSGYLVPGPGYSTELPWSSDNIYGPGRTVRWQDMGSYRAQKFTEVSVDVVANGQFVNEIFLVAEKNQIDIRSVQARLWNGQIIGLNHLTGTVREGQSLRLRLDRYYSLRIERLVVNMISPNLIGPRGSLQIQLGLAY